MLKITLDADDFVNNGIIRGNVGNIKGKNDCFNDGEFIFDDTLICNIASGTLHSQKGTGKINVGNYFYFKGSEFYTDQIVDAPKVELNLDIGFYNTAKLKHSYFDITAPYLKNYGSIQSSALFKSKTSYFENNGHVLSNDLLVDAEEIKSTGHLNTNTTSLFGQNISLNGHVNSDKLAVEGTSVDIYGSIDTKEIYLKALETLNNRGSINYKSRYLSNKDGKDIYLPLFHAAKLNNYGNIYSEIIFHPIVGSLENYGSIESESYSYLEIPQICNRGRFKSSEFYFDTDLITTSCGGYNDVTGSFESSGNSTFVVKAKDGIKIGDIISGDDISLESKEAIEHSGINTSKRMAVLTPDAYHSLGNIHAKSLDVKGASSIIIDKDIAPRQYVTLKSNGNILTKNIKSSQEIKLAAKGYTRVGTLDANKIEIESLKGMDIKHINTKKLKLITDKEIYHSDLTATTSADISAKKSYLAFGNINTPKMIINGTGNAHIGRGRSRNRYQINLHGESIGDGFFADVQNELRFDSPISASVPFVAIAEKQVTFPSLSSTMPINIYSNRVEFNDIKNKEDVVIFADDSITCDRIASKTFTGHSAKLNINSITTKEEAILTVPECPSFSVSTGGDLVLLDNNGTLTYDSKNQHCTNLDIGGAFAFHGSGFYNYDPQTFNGLEIKTTSGNSFFNEAEDFVVNGDFIYNGTGEFTNIGEITVNGHGQIIADFFVNKKEVIGSFKRYDNVVVGGWRTKQPGKMSACSLEIYTRKGNIENIGGDILTHMESSSVLYDEQYHYRKNPVCSEASDKPFNMKLISAGSIVNGYIRSKSFLNGKYWGSKNDLLIKGSMVSGGNLSLNATNEGIINKGSKIHTNGDLRINGKKNIQHLEARENCCSEHAWKGGDHLIPETKILGETYYETEIGDIVIEGSLLSKHGAHFKSGRDFIMSSVAQQNDCGVGARLGACGDRFSLGSIEYSMLTDGDFSSAIATPKSGRSVIGRGSGKDFVGGEGSSPNFPVKTNTLS